MCDVYGVYLFYGNRGSGYPRTELYTLQLRTANYTVLRTPYLIQDTDYLLSTLQYSMVLVEQHYDNTLWLIYICEDCTDTVTSHDCA